VPYALLIRQCHIARYSAAYLITFNHTAADLALLCFTTVPGMKAVDDGATHGFLVTEDPLMTFPLMALLKIVATSNTGMLYRLHYPILYKYNKPQSRSGLAARPSASSPAKQIHRRIIRYKYRSIYLFITVRHFLISASQH